MNRLYMLLTVMVVMVGMVGAFFAAHEAIAKVLTGSGADDTLVGTDGDDLLTGNRGNDKIVSGEGNDTMKGETGNDILTGGPNNDTMDGGGDNDTYTFADDFGADRISADSAGVDTLNFVALTSTFTDGKGISVDLRGQGSKLCPTTANGCHSVAGPFIENVVGTVFKDDLRGNPSGNKINGSGGGGNNERGVGEEEKNPPRSD